MTNANIILMECATRGIIEEVHTYARWKQMGYVVKKGEKALFETSLWKMCNHKNKKDDNAVETDEENHQRMYLCKSFLFGKSQVEELKEDK